MFVRIDAQVPFHGSSHGAAVNVSALAGAAAFLLLAHLHVRSHLLDFDFLYDTEKGVSVRVDVAWNTR